MQFLNINIVMLNSLKINFFIVFDFENHLHDVTFYLTSMSVFVMIIMIELHILLSRGEIE